MMVLLEGLIASNCLYSNGQYLMKRSGDAQHGAKAETELARLLLSLENLGWQVE